MDLSLLLPVIGLIFTVVSKLLLLYSTIDAMEKFMLGHRIKRQGWEWAVSSGQ